MIIKRYKPVTPSLRQLETIEHKNLWKGKPYKKLTVGLNQKGGRNNNGHITINHRGGGHKRKYRLISFSLKNIERAEVIRIEYDPNRSSNIALIKDLNLDKCYYILAHNSIKVGDILDNTIGADIEPGNNLPLRQIPIGSMIHNIELYPGKGGQLCRSAGAYGSLIQKNDSGYAMVRLISGEIRMIPLECRATLGIVSNVDNKNINLGKAGRNRWLGKRPVVRGVAMNPVDHPHGGGEGKTSGGRPSVTPWGIPTKGYKTRRNKKTNKYIIKNKK